MSFITRVHRKHRAFGDLIFASADKGKEMAWPRRTSRGWAVEALHLKEPLRETSHCWESSKMRAEGGELSVLRGAIRSEFFPFTLPASCSGYAIGGENCKSSFTNLLSKHKPFLEGNKQVSLDRLDRNCVSGDERRRWKLLKLAYAPLGKRKGRFGQTEFVTGVESENKETMLRFRDPNSPLLGLENPIFPQRLGFVRVNYKAVEGTTEEKYKGAVLVLFDEDFALEPRAG